MQQRSRLFDRRYVPSVEESILAPAFMTNDGVAAEICPPCPGLSSATAVMEKGGLFEAPITSNIPALAGRVTPRPLIAVTNAAKFGVATPKRVTKNGLSFSAKASSAAVGGGAVKLMIPPFAPDMVSDLPAEHLQIRPCQTVSRRAYLSLVESVSAQLL